MVRPPMTDEVPDPVGAAAPPVGPVDVAEQLREFLEHDYTSVVAAVGLISRDRAGAEDAVQDALVKLLTRPPAEPLRSVAAWVTVVASNEARSQLRRQGAEDRAVTRLGGRRDPGDPLPEAVIDLTLDNERVLAAMHELPLRQRQIAVLHYYLDTAVLDIASGLGVSEGTVKTQLHRARHTLAETLGTEGPDTPDADVTDLDLTDGSADGGREGGAS